MGVLLASFSCSYKKKKIKIKTRIVSIPMGTESNFLFAPNDRYNI
jgi:hypothetical protein